MGSAQYLILTNDDFINACDHTLGVECGKGIHQRAYWGNGDVCLDCDSDCNTIYAC